MIVTSSVRKFAVNSTYVVPDRGPMVQLFAASQKAGPTVGPLTFSSLKRMPPSSRVCACSLDARLVVGGVDVCGTNSVVLAVLHWPEVDRVPFQP